MYANLECFLEHFREQEIDFKYLLWGEEYKIEQTLLDLIENISNEIYDGEIQSDWSNVFLLQPRNMVLTLPLTTVFKRNYGLVKFQIQTSIII